MKAYDDASLEEAALGQAWAHDLRALAASWNIHCSIPLSDILLAAQWRSHNTFTSFYLRDMFGHPSSWTHLHRPSYPFFITSTLQRLRPINYRLCEPRLPGFWDRLALFEVIFQNDLERSGSRSWCE